MLVPIPVSYTHLDVYKRQALVKDPTPLLGGYFGDRGDLLQKDLDILGRLFSICLLYTSIFHSQTRPPTPASSVAAPER